jgi:hypothetical protein
MLETKKESLGVNISEDEMEKKKAESADMGSFKQRYITHHRNFGYYLNRMDFR